MFKLLLILTAIFSFNQSYGVEEDLKHILPEGERQHFGKLNWSFRDLPLYKKKGNRRINPEECKIIEDYRAQPHMREARIKVFNDARAHQLLKTINDVKECIERTKSRYLAGQKTKDEMNADIIKMINTANKTLHTQRTNISRPQPLTDDDFDTYFKIEDYIE
jgi:hypothetical protein